MKKEITLSQAQKQVDNWINTIGVKYFSELGNLAQLMEEVGELSSIINRTYGEQSFKSKTEEQKANLGDEMADILFVLICLANQTNINLTESFQTNLLKKTKRDEFRHKQNKKLI